MIYSKLLRHVMYPIIEIKYPIDERKMFHLNYFMKSQWWSLENLIKLQEKKLRSLLEHAYQNVPYYHNLFRSLNLKPNDIKNQKSLQKLPILTKRTVRDHFNELIAKNYPNQKLISSSTSGSTGEPMKFYVDRRWDSYNFAAALRQWNWAGYSLGDKTAYLWSSHRDLSLQKELKNQLLNIIRRTIFLNGLDLNEENIKKIIRELQQFKPKFINSYSSASYLLAKYLNNMDIRDISPQSILTTSDMLDDYKRKRIEDVFNCEVFDYYSGRDTSLQAGECDEHIGYHLSIENAIAEFLKKNEPVSSGEHGKIVITDFSNYSMPFIRYEIGDLGVYSDEKCPCGRGLPLMKSISGRILDTIITPEGNYITGEFFPYLITYHNINGIDQYQIIQENKNELKVFIVKQKDAKNEQISIFQELIKKYLGNQMEVKILFVDEIPLSKSGKFRHVLSKLSIEDYF